MKFGGIVGHIEVVLRAYFQCHITLGFGGGPLSCKTRLQTTTFLRAIDLKHHFLLKNHGERFVKQCLWVTHTKFGIKISKGKKVTIGQSLGIFGGCRGCFRGLLEAAGC